MDKKALPKSNKHEKNQQKRRKEKIRQSFKTPSFFFFLSSSFVFIFHYHLHKNKKIVKPKRRAFFFIIFLFLCKWWWEMKTKENERMKKKEGVLEDCLIFSFLLFCWFFSCLFDLGNVFWSKFGRFFWGFERFRVLGILNQYYSLVNSTGIFVIFIDKYVFYQAFMFY